MSHDRWIGRLTDRIALAAGWWLLLYAAAVCIEIVARKLLHTSIQGIDEIGGYTLAVVAAFGYSGALLGRSHTRVDFVLTRLSPRLQSRLNLLAMLSMAVLAGFLAEGAWRVLGESLEFQARSTSPLRTPLAVPQALWFAGLLLFLLTALVLAVEAVVGVMRAPPEVANRRYGPPSLQDEIRAESGLDVDAAAGVKP